MLKEVRRDMLKVETKGFTPPLGFVPKRLSGSQFKKISKALAQKDGEVRDKQYRFLNLMGLIQTNFKKQETRKTPNIKEIIHRKMCDGNLAAAFKIAKGEMHKERVDIAQEDIETLFPMNLNENWGIMNYPKASRTITDERIDSLIARLPRDRAPGRSRITYGHIKKLNANEKTKTQIHEPVKHIYSNPDKIPEEFYTAELILIPKPNGGNDQ